MNFGVIVARIDAEWLRNNVNDKADYTYAQHAGDYLGRCIGAFRTTQLIQKTMNLGSALIDKVGRVPAALGGLSRDLGAAMNVLGVLRVPSALVGAKKSLEELQDLTSDVGFSRRAVKAVGDAADAVAACGFAHSFVTRSPAFVPLAATADFMADAVDAKVSVEDYYKAIELEQQATGEVKVAVSHTKNYQFFRAIKATLAVALTALGFVLFALGMPLIALMMVGVASTALAIARDIYKESGRYKVIQLDGDVTLGTI